MILKSDGTLWSRPIWVDFMRTDWDNRVLLDLPGTAEDIKVHGIPLKDGLRLVLYTEDADKNGRIDDLVTVGTVEFDADERRWVAEVNWEVLRHVSELDAVERNQYLSARSSKS